MVADKNQFLGFSSVVSKYFKWKMCREKNAEFVSDKDSVSSVDLLKTGLRTECVCKIFGRFYNASCHLDKMCDC